MKKLTLFYDRGNANVFFDGIPSVIDNRNDVARFQKMFEEVAGDSTKTIIYNAAKKSGAWIANSIKEEQISPNEKFKRSRKEFALRVIEHLYKRGYGVFKLKEFDEKEFKAKVEIKNCYNSIGYENFKHPVCYEMSGTLAGVFRVIFDIVVECIEKKCSGVESDYCEFEIIEPPSNAGSEREKEDKDEKEPVEPLLETIHEIGEKDAEKKFKKFFVSFDEKKGEIIFENTSSVIQPRNHDAIFQREFEKIIGEKTKRISYNRAKNAAMEAVTNFQKALIKILGVFSKKEFILRLKEDAIKRGYGVVDLADYNEKKGYVKLRVKNSYNAIGYRKGRTPKCHTFSGMIAGAAEIIFGKESVCVETKCVVKGDPCCEFEVFRRTEKEVLQNLLRSLNKTVNMENSLIIARDGNLLASELQPELNSESFTSMVAVVSGASEKALNELKGELYERVIVETKDSRIIITRVGENADLITIAKPDIALGLALTEIEKTLKKVEHELELIKER